MARNGGSRSKRERSEMENDQDLEFMPLSKRITVLNLNPNSNESTRDSMTPTPPSYSDSNQQPQGIGHDSGFRTPPSNSSQGSASSSDISSLPLTMNGIYLDDNSIDMSITRRSSQHFSPANQNGFHQIHNRSHYTTGQGFTTYEEWARACRAAITPLPIYRHDDVHNNERSNPHYHEENRRLFWLYLERMERLSAQPHPDVIRQSSSNPNP